jgi:hypothetical protein
MGPSRIATVVSVTLGLAYLAGLRPAVSSAEVVEVTRVMKFSGTVTDITIQREPRGHGQVEYRIRGIFEAPDVDLGNSRLVLDAVFFEGGTGGAEELITTRDDIRLFPGFVVEARDGSEPERAIYDSGAQFRPQMRLTVQQRRGVYEFRFKMDRGLARRGPNLCRVVPGARRRMTDITQSFTIQSLDGSDPDIRVTTTQPWECMKEGKDRKNMRSRPKDDDQPAGDLEDMNSAPQANLEDRMIAPDTLELDGSGSQDNDGTVVSFDFEVRGKETGEVVFDPPQGPDAIVRTSLPAGRYVARLVVADTLGATGTDEKEFTIEGRDSWEEATVDENRAPQAKIRETIVAPGVVELDGSRSEDKDGSIVSYDFAVSVRGTGEVVLDLPPGPDAMIRVALPAGDYEASLVVADEDGDSSKPAIRRITIRE